MDVLSLLFPQKCIRCHTFGSYLCTDCFTLLDFDVALICAVCGRAAIRGRTHPGCMGKWDINGVFASLVYKGVCKKLIYQFKFSPFLTHLKIVMGDLFYEGLIQQEDFVHLSGENAILIPIPLSRQKERQRGYNQAEILATELAKHFGMPVKDVLFRKHETQSQVGKTQKERRANLLGAFGINEKDTALIRNKTVFVVDDVLTSGATMNEAAKTLKRAGAKEVWGLAFAHGV